MKADYERAYTLFLDESIGFGLWSVGKGPLEVQRKYKEFSKKVDGQLQSVGWTFQELRTHEPTPEERLIIDRLTNQKTRS